MTGTILGHEQAHWRDSADFWTQQFPDIHALARDEAMRILKRHTGRDLEPEQVWWHRFDNAVSSPRSYTGWQHSGRPLQSLTFIELLLQRYPAQDQDSLDNLQVEGGFYLDGPGHGVYDERNEVRLLATQVSDDFWKLDFAALYKTQLSRFWLNQGYNFLLLAKLTLRAAVVVARQRNELTVADLSSLQALFNGQPVDKVYQLTLGPYRARDVLCMVTATGRQILYLPGDTQALRVFANIDDLYRWLRHTAANATDRDALLRHFSSFNIAHASELQGLRELLEQLREDDEGVWIERVLHREPAIIGDPFVWLRKSAHREMILQAETLLTTNTGLRQQMWLGYLSAFISLGNGFAPLGWPVALLVIGAAAASLVIHVNKAIYATTYAQRRESIKGAINSAIAMAFNTPLLFEARLQNELTPLAQEDAVAPLIDGQRAELIPLIPPPAASVPLSGGHMNGLGLIERADFKSLYSVTPLPRGTHPASVIDTIRPNVDFAHAQQMLEGPSFRVFATPSGALRYAQSEFDGPFVMHEIDAEGLPAVSFRENFEHNQAALLRHQGQAKDALQNYWREGRGLGDWANGAWTFDEVHVAVESLDPGHFLPVAADEINRLTLSLQTLDISAGGPAMLRGVRITPPSAGHPMPRYNIEIENLVHQVRYEPLSATWRTDEGLAYRFDELAERFIQIMDPTTLPMRPAVEVDHAVLQLGIGARLPWQVEPLPTVGALPMPRKLHSIWLGKHMPRKFIKRVIHNAQEAGQGERPFEVHLYLDIKDPTELDTTLLRLGAEPSPLKIHMLERTTFFAAFRKTPYYRQYRAASSGPAANYASAVDILRYPLINSEGGLYMDVDDLIEASGDGVANFADQDFNVQPGYLLLNNLVFHRRLQMLLDFNTSNFGSLPGNPLLERISQESYRRFLADPGLYQSRPFDFLNTDREMDAYGQQISYTTGPRLFNQVLDEQLPAYRQYRGLQRIARGELYVQAAARKALLEQLQAQVQHYSALGGLIRIGSTGSWLYT